MTKLTEEQRREINKALRDELYDDNQGIFVEGWCVPNDIKEACLYSRYVTGGYTGGSYHEDSYLHPYTASSPNSPFKVLDLVLEKLYPQIGYLDYKLIESMWKNLDETDSSDYYGNSDDYSVNYLPLSQVEDAIEKIKNRT